MPGGERDSNGFGGRGRGYGGPRGGRRGGGYGGPRGGRSVLLSPFPCQASSLWPVRFRHLISTKSRSSSLSLSSVSSFLQQPNLVNVLKSSAFCRGRPDPRGMVGYHDLDAPEDVEIY